MIDINIFQILITIFAIFALSRSFLRFKARQESRLEFLMWIIVWVSVVVFVFWPQLTDIPAAYLGIQSGISLMVYVSILFLLYATYRSYSKIEKLEQEITTLTRKVALKEGGKKKK